MRISDWSSDVCSSDLPEAGVDDTLPATAATEVQAAPIQAELDYAAIYGEPPYDPVYDDTLPAPAQMPQSYDPWDGLNRRVHTFKNVVDRTISTPLAKAYAKVVPRDRKSTRLTSSH